MFYAPSFWFKTFKKVLSDVPDRSEDITTEQSIVIFYQAESHDVDNKNRVMTKLLKNIKWMAGKFKTKHVVLHSFGHLSLSKAPPDFTRQLIEEAGKRLTDSGFCVIETPFGYLNEWKIHVAGESLAKVFKEF